MKKILALILTAFMLTIVSNASAKKMVMKVAHESEGEIRYPGTGSTAGLIAMQSFLASASAGNMELKIFPDNSLGNSRSLMEQAQQGIIQFNRTYGNIMIPFCPEIAVTGIPFLFRNNQIAWRVMNGPFGDELAAKYLEKTGLRILAWGEAGYRNIYNNNKFVKKPSDLDGVKVRVPENPGLLALFQSFGAKPVTITWSEIYTGLQSGMAQATDTELHPYYLKKLHEVVPYVTMTRHIYGMHPLMVNEEYYQKLSVEDKQIIQEAAVLYNTVTDGFARLSEIGTAELLLKEGAHIYEPTREEIALFKKVSTEPYLEYLRTQVDPVWIDKIFAAVDEAEEYYSKKAQQ